MCLIVEKVSFRHFMIFNATVQHKTKRNVSRHDTDLQVRDTCKICTIHTSDHRITEVEIRTPFAQPHKIRNHKHSKRRPFEYSSGRRSTNGWIHITVTQYRGGSQIFPLIIWRMVIFQLCDRCYREAVLLKGQSQCNLRAV